jgi:Uma2 family endonuclease
MATTRLFTAEELWDQVAEGQQYELIEGNLVEVPPNNGLHSRIVLFLSRILASSLEDSGLGVVYPADASFILNRNPDTVLAPDLAFVRAANVPPIEEQEGLLETTPDLVVEVVSPSNSSVEIERKVETYLKYGVLRVWVVYPRERVVVVHQSGLPEQRLSDTDMIDAEDLQGFQNSGRADISHTLAFILSRTHPRDDMTSLCYTRARVIRRGTRSEKPFGFASTELQQ